ncbi:class F sortase [Enemella dayhoffiae]|uniref:Class F sortase n=1 Tax=Enemella dayhoffiae TaxID=2016507 RepID=A0A255H2Y2_9ACTN|nr:class F sortase [Enemella dayhoffiae]
MDDPKKLTVERIGVNSPMMTVGKDSDGNPGAPPKNQANTTAWYNGSPEVGSDKGNVILTIHTYHAGGALGNQLYSDKGLKDGDIIKISDGAGKQVCYRYTRNTKVWVKTYDPASGVFFNPTGPAQLAIMICWDYDKSRDDWDSRIIFYAPRIPKGA